MMEQEQYTEHSVAIERHEQQIKTLFRRQDELDRLTQSVNELALSVRGMVERLTTVETRVRSIEDDSKHRARTIWACLVTGVLGAAVSWIMATILK